MLKYIWEAVTQIGLYPNECLILNAEKPFQTSDQ